MGLFTVRGVDPVTVPREALIVVLPGAFVVARPLLSIEATELFDDVHIT